MSQASISYLNKFLVPIASIDVRENTRNSLKRQHLAPVHHVYYLKTHKTASTSVYSILAEYCRSHELLPLLPAHMHINLKAPFSPSQVILDSNIIHYDMVFNHHIYDHNIFKYLHNDTFRFTTLREPFSHFVSSFNFFKYIEEFPYLKKINSTNPIETFLADRDKYEVDGYSSFTNNRQSMDLGYNLSHSFSDIDYINVFVNQTENRFHLVLISDYFHESVILLKRVLRWRTQDVLYYRKLTTNRIMNVSDDVLKLYKQQHRVFSTADYKMYSYFLQVFKQRISQEKDLFGEVQEFETVLAQVHSFCNKNQTAQSQLVIQTGRWSDQIDIKYSKCKWLQLGEIAFTEHLKNIRKYVLRNRYKTQHFQT